MGFDLATTFETVAAAVPDRECIVFRDRRLTYAQVAGRAARLANVLFGHGITLHRERDRLAGWESGQDHVALYLHNGNEYLEGMLGAAAARAASVNVNYRYGEEELGSLLADAGPAAIVFHAAFAPTLRAVLGRLERPPLLLQVDDGSGAGLEGALDYEAALAAASPDPPALERSADDLYILYTGGTTGQPKGTLWRWADIYDTTLRSVAAWGGIDTSSLDALAAGVAAAPGLRVLPAPPLMHGAGQWVALATLLAGGTVVLPDVVEQLDAASILDAMERERVQGLVIVGDSFARPLCEELERRPRDLGELRIVLSGGAALSTGMKARLLGLLPQIVIMDSGGASETGPQLSNVSAGGTEPTTGVFAPSPRTFVLDADRRQVLGPGHQGVGWLAHDGPIPLGYLHDETKSRETFPVVEGRRMSVPGDRARLRADGQLELLGRDATTINSGGEKIFAEEVEQALLAHPDVVDVLVVGRPSEVWGQEVTAVVQLVAGSTVSDADLHDLVVARLARYKAPKSIVRVDRVRRTPAGKADYAWARSVAVPPSQQTPGG